VAVPLEETVSSRLWRFYYGWRWWFYCGWRMCCICIYIYSYVAPCMQYVRPDRPPLPQEGAIGGWWCALYIARPHPPQERADG
jgi:hypothetical protein